MFEIGPTEVEDSGFMSKRNNINPFPSLQNLLLCSSIVSNHRFLHFLNLAEKCSILAAAAVV